jgi:hypothetical protein
VILLPGLGPLENSHDLAARPVAFPTWTVSSPDESCDCNDGDSLIGTEDELVPFEMIPYDWEEISVSQDDIRNAWHADLGLKSLIVFDAHADLRQVSVRQLESECDAIMFVDIIHQQPRRQIETRWESEQAVCQICKTERVFPVIFVGRTEISSQPTCRVCRESQKIGDLYSEADVAFIREWKRTCRYSEYFNNPFIRIELDVQALCENGFDSTRLFCLANLIESWCISTINGICALVVSKRGKGCSGPSEVVVVHVHGAMDLDAAKEIAKIIKQKCRSSVRGYDSRRVPVVPSEQFSSLDHDDPNCIFEKSSISDDYVTIQRHYGIEAARCAMAEDWTQDGNSLAFAEALAAARCFFGRPDSIKRKSGRGIFGMLSTRSASVQAIGKAVHTSAAHTRDAEYLQGPSAELFGSGPPEASAVDMMQPETARSLSNAQMRAMRAAKRTSRLRECRIAEAKESVPPC